MSRGVNRLNAASARLLVDGCGLLSLGGWLLLAFTSRQAAPFPIELFFFLHALLWTACIGAFWATRATGKIGMTRVLVWALALRAVAWWAEPVYEDDYYRYLWDGYTFAQHGSPYGKTPEQEFGNESVPAEWQQILSGINNPSLPTIYPPLAQAAFLVAHQIAPGQLWPLKLLFAIGDFFLILVLLRWVAPHQLLLALWCPLLLFETYTNLHPELLGVGLAVLAVFQLNRRRGGEAAVLAVLAMGIKPLAFPVTAWVLWRCNMAARLAGVLTFGLLYGYFLWHDGWMALGSLGAFVQEWEFNSFLYALFQHELGLPYARELCSGVFLVFLFAWGQHTAQQVGEAPRFDWLYLGLFFCSPVVNPWYLLWMLPWVALRPRLWTVTALAVVTLAYATGQNLGETSAGQYAHPTWVRFAEFGAVALAAVAGTIWTYSRSRRAAKVLPTQ